MEFSLCGLNEGIAGGSELAIEILKFLIAESPSALSHLEHRLQNLSHTSRCVADWMRTITAEQGD